MKYLTKEWYEKCQIAGRPPFDEKLDKEIEAVMNTYYNEYKKEFSLIPEFMETIDMLHDCDIVSFRVNGDDYIIRTDNSEWGMNGFTDIVIKNPIVIKKKFSDDIKGLIWLYQEIYRTPKGYELHCLFYQRVIGDLFELTVDCEDIEIFDVE